MTVLALALVAWGCDSETGTDAGSGTDAGGAADSGPGTDAGGTDAGAADAGGEGTDAGALDAGGDGSDAGDTDAGAADAGPGDAGPTSETPSAPGDIVITELMPSPEDVGADSQADWIEVHNPSATVTYNLRGCSFSDNTGRAEIDRHVFDADVLIPPGGYVAISLAVRATAAAETVGYTSSYDTDDQPGGLGGGGEDPLIVCGGTIIDLVDYNGYPYAGGISAQLNPFVLDATSNDDAGNWCASMASYSTGNLGTPGQPNDPCPAVTPSAAGELVITELMPSPEDVGAEGQADWIEVHNPSASVTYNLVGCAFSDNTGRAEGARHVFDADVLIPPGGYVAVSLAERANAAAQTMGYTSAYDTDDQPGGLAGGGEDPLIACGATIIDVVDYNGYPYNDGVSAQLAPTSLDATANDSAANWCASATSYSTGNLGTPGVANDPCL